MSETLLTRVAPDNMPEGARAAYDALQELTGDATFVEAVANGLGAASEQRRVEEKLRSSQARMSSILAAAADAIISVDEEQRITLFNHGGEAIFGYRSEEILGRPLDVLIPDDQVAPHRGHMRAFGAEAQTARAMAARRSVSGRRKDGSVFPAEVGISKATQPEGIVFTAVVRDVSERTLLQTQVAASQRFEAVGQLAAGIAHDFNNLLTGITGFATMAQQSIAAEHPALADIEEVIKASERAARLTRQLLAFARQQELAPEKLELNAIVGDLEAMARRIVAADIDLVLELQPDLAIVEIDRGQAEQVIINLVVNARDAMPAGGTLTIATRNVVLEQPVPRAEVSIEPGSYCLLSVSDTGSGMSPETRARVFEPFFTTKDRGEGTGMGLSTVYGIVKQSGGYIFVDSEIDAGTSIKIYLPQAEPKYVG